MAYKPLMDWFDEHEGRKAGDSHRAIEKEKARQGYAKSKAVAKKTNLKGYKPMGHGMAYNPKHGAANLSEEDYARLKKQK